MVQIGLTEETYEEAEYDSSDDKSPVPYVIISDERDAEEHENDAVTRRTKIQQQQHQRQLSSTHLP